MKCINCNQEINDGARMCQYCGAAQPIGQVVNNIAAAAPEQLPPLPEAGMEPLPPFQEEATEPLQQASDLNPYMPNQDDPLGTKPVQGYDYQDPTFDEQPKKKGMAGWLKALIITLVTLLVLGGGAAAFWFLYWNVNKLEVVDKKDKEVEVVKFNRNGGTKKLKIETDAKGDFVEVAESPDWVDVEIDGDELIIKCKKLKKDKDRNGEIELKAHNKTTTITVKQNSDATYIDVSETEINADASEETKVVYIDTDGDIEKFDFDCDSWIEVIDKTDSSFMLRISKNYSSDTRRGTVIISSGEAEATVNVTQEGYCSWCNGSGEVTCDVCYGSGQRYNYDYDEYFDCYNCGGSGKITCPYCGGGQR